MSTCRACNKFAPIAEPVGHLSVITYSAGKEVVATVIVEAVTTDIPLKLASPFTECFYGGVYNVRAYYEGMKITRTITIVPDQQQQLILDFSQPDIATVGGINPTALVALIGALVGVGLLAGGS